MQDKKTKAFRFSLAFCSLIKAGVSVGGVFHVQLDEGILCVCVFVGFVKGYVSCFSPFCLWVLLVQD